MSIFRREEEQDQSGVVRPTFGKYRALVVDNQDPEQRGRVRVKVPTVYGDNYVSDWALPSHAYGGNNVGVFFVPELGDGVWVEFEMGNPDFPLYAGSWYADGETPSQGKTAELGGHNVYQHNKVIRTASGHTIEMCDLPGGEYLSITDARGTRIHLQDDKCYIVAPESVVIQGASTIEATAETVKAVAKNAYIKCVQESGAGGLCAVECEDMTATVHNDLSASITRDATLTVGRNLLANVTGTVKVVSLDSVELEAPSIYLDGNVFISGNLDFDWGGGGTGVIKLIANQIIATSPTIDMNGLVTVN